jgi:RNA polymerase sigma-70 factor (ECF subfamily)
MRDTSEFDAFYAASAGRVVAHVYALTGSRTEAEDAAAEAFVRAWQRWNSVRQADSPEAWVRRVASRIAVSAWRKTVSRLKAHRRETPVQGVPGLSEDHVALVSALQQLTVNQRRAIVLHYLADRSVAEIAVEMNAPTGTVKAHLARGRKAMAGLLAEVPGQSAGRHG